MKDNSNKKTTMAPLRPLVVFACLSMLAGPPADAAQEAGNAPPAADETLVYVIGMDLTRPATGGVEPDDEHAVITVFRRDKKDRLKMALWSGDGYIAAVEVKEGVKVKVPPGEHYLFAGLIPDTVIHANVEPGRNYFVSIDIGMVKIKVEPVGTRDKKKLDKWLKKVTFVAALDPERRTDRVREREQIVTEFLNSTFTGAGAYKTIGPQHAF